VTKYDLTRLKAASANRWSESSVSFEPIATFVPMRLKEMSSFPALVTTSRRCASTDSGLRASTFEKSATPPALEISWAMGLSEFSVRPARKTVAPSLANAWATALPSRPTASDPESEERLQLTCWLVS
jgi:hypothetical protein